MKPVLTLSLLCCLGLNVSAQGTLNQLIYTRPERTLYEETSLHADVIQFVSALSESSDFARWTPMGTSQEGKVLPLVILANPMVDNLDQAMNSGKARIYIQANIHGGEVEGKEALMILMRDMLLETKSHLLENQILLFCPIFNPDGNDNLGPNNRRNQDGSPYLAGTRANGQGYDLNRDGLKMETPEGKALASLMKEWDPHMFVDLHTTNGTWHGYEITYAPGLTTAGYSGSEDFMNEELLPWLSNRLRQRTGFETYYYGGFYEYPPKSYYGMYPQPRFWTNSFSLKNKLALLVETFSHDHFEKRILSNVHFVNTLLEYTNSNSEAVQSAVANADAAVIQEIATAATPFSKGVSFDYGHPETDDLLVYEVRGSKRTQKKLWFPNVNSYLAMSPQQSAKVPKAYVFPASLSHVADKLEEHGVEFETLTESRSYTGEKFVVSSLTRDSREYQGHFPASLTGAFEEATQSFPAGSYVVNMQQKLAYLIFYLLEPKADDGLVYWNYFDQYLLDQGVQTGSVDFPVFKSFDGNVGMGENDQDQVQVYQSDWGGLYINGLMPTQKEKYIEIVKANGQIVKHIKLDANLVNYSLSTEGMAQGLYLVRIHQDGVNVVRKLVLRLAE